MLNMYEEIKQAVEQRKELIYVTVQDGNCPVQVVIDRSKAIKILAELERRFNPTTEPKI